MFFLLAFSLGSSPPVRGAQGCGGAVGGFLGLIPARAGSTLLLGAACSLAGAHPRPCGEHWRAIPAQSAGSGSSPPVRGARELPFAPLPRAGLIPARAGSTTERGVLRAAIGAHPRPCGEHAGGIRSTVQLQGSSPPVRGALSRDSVEIRGDGLIPARAGSTRRCYTSARTGRAHPRPCGEHRTLARIFQRIWGSSPPVRGAHPLMQPGDDEVGLIPARAGSTLLIPLRILAAGAHPRPCGEHVQINMQVLSHTGSSPPVRGAHMTADSFHVRGGLIPARAGSTPPNQHCPCGTRAHPRPCGEHIVTVDSVDTSKGSSPPVRGAHLLTWGFIPYTGKIGLLWSQSLRPEYTINNCS